MILEFNSPVRSTLPVSVARSSVVAGLRRVPHIRKSVLMAPESWCLWSSLNMFTSAAEKTVQVTYDKVKEVRAVGRGFGLWGDMVWC